jgi:hypothetical protein
MPRIVRNSQSEVGIFLHKNAENAHSDARQISPSCRHLAKHGLTTPIRLYRYGNEGPLSERAC